MSLARRPFKRPQYERAPRVPVRPLSDCRGVVRQVGDEVRACPKEIIHRSEAYRRFVASQECFGCRITSFSQCAHLNEGKGLGLKVCDSKTFPLCAPHWGQIGCHQQYDLLVDMGRIHARMVGAEYVERMRERAQAAGWRFTAEGILRP